MKILFSMHQPGFVRHFQRTLGLLCEEGHSVHILFHNEKVDPAEWTAELRQAHPRVTFSVTTLRRKDEWEESARRLRSALDYLMYSDWRYAEAHRLRANAAREVDADLLVRLERVAPSRVKRSLLDLSLRIAERAIPSDPGIDALIAEQAPDVMLVTPLVAFNSLQVDYVKAARALGIPCALCVASWDNLTNKGRMRELPDRVFVWNEAQAQEAVTLHKYPRSRVVVTGAQSFDHWFEFEQSRSRDDFLRERGLEPDRALILYLCSSTSISPNEIKLIRQWHDAVRRAPDERVRNAALLVRPHPVNKQPWSELDALALPNFAVWPRDSMGPFNPKERCDYFDSIFHADAVVGLNTSGQVEAGLIGKPVLTLLSKDIAHTLQGTTDTVHFAHLLQINGGLLHVAGSFEEHHAQLARALAADPVMTERSQRFTDVFIRPHGIGQAASPILADAIRSLAKLKPHLPFRDRAIFQPLLGRLVRRLARPPQVVPNDKKGSERPAGKPG